ncbi:MAG: ABC transporter substrate-binding protein [Phycisphaerales bacterium]
MNQPPASPSNAPAPRVVSLCPAATDALCGFGAADLLVGRSPGCDHPASLRAPVVEGPNRAVFADRLAALSPDIILAGPGHDQQVPAGCRLVPVSPTTIEGIFDAVLTVGREVGRPADAGRMVVHLRDRFFAANEFVNPYDDGPLTVFLESAQPLVVSGDWIAQLIERAGALHPLNPTTARPTAGSGSGPQFAERVAGRAVRVPDEVLAAINPQRLILCAAAGGLEASRAIARDLSGRRWWGGLRAVQSGHVALIDGTRTLHRPGPGVVEGYEWLVRWLAAS